LESLSEGPKLLVMKLHAGAAVTEGGRDFL